ncbi:MAG: VWA domain-containing protein [Planctomycetaceae bacterium]|jgi:hypothetical protein|nr:VWA domain-containing protein [Planctomycetaceae bacterium]
MREPNEVTSNAAVVTSARSSTSGMSGGLGGEEAASWREWLPPIAMRAAIAGIAISLVVHVVLLMVSGVIRIGSGGGEGTPGPVPGVEVAVITNTELAALESAPLSSLNPGVDDVTQQVPGNDLQTMPSIDTPGGQATPGTGDLGGVGTGLGGAGSGSGIGIGDGAGGSGGGGTRFFGVEARGSRFVYVVDVSGSMQGEKLQALKVNLIESIQSVVESGSVVVIPFSSDARPLLGRERWTDASDRAKADFARAIQALGAEGGTNPIPALTIALGLRPRPDAIYFMTDGLFEEEVADVLERVNRGAAKVPIHCISLVDRSSEHLMRRIAKSSGGSYNHVEGRP